MREIKYRVWDSDLKKMRYLNSSHDIIEFDEKGIGEYHNLQTGYGEWFSELMQFTGLFDKNNKPIYEGDIINNKDILEDVNYEVIFDKGAFYGKRKNYWYPEEDVFLKLYIVDKENIEVVGNIYEKEE